MENQHARVQIVRELINETITPQEERAVMTWIAARSTDGMKSIHESAPLMHTVLRSLEDLRESKVNPAAPEAQALVVRENELAVRYGVRDFAASMFEWDATIAQKWLHMSERAASRMNSSEAATPDEGLVAYLRATLSASPWHRALEPIVDEAAAFADRKVQPSAAPAQVLVGRLRRICVDHSLGEPLLYVRHARAMQFRWPAEDIARKRVGWAFLANAIEAAPSAARDTARSPRSISHR